MIELRNYQKNVAKEEVDRNNLLVVAPMGSGKTLASLTAVATLVYRGDVKNVLIIAPKRVASSVWQQEAEAYNMGLNVRYCEKAVDIKLFLVEPSNHRVCVCSVTRIEEIPHGCWDMVIIDESTLFGNKKALRSKEVRRICHKVPRRILLTGTPIHGGYEKLWHQIFLLDGGASLGKTLTAFRTKYMRIKYQVMGVVTVYEINPVMIETLLNDIKHLVYIVKDSVPLPPCLYKNIYIDLPSKRRKEYDEFEQTSIIKFEAEYKQGAYQDAKTLIAFASSSRGAKLRQLATGVVYADETNTTYDILHIEKIQAMRELRESYDGGILVAYQFISECQELKKAFPKIRLLETPADIAEWNAGNIDMAMGHPQSLGHGLNLQKGGNVVVWYSPTYDAELYSQFNGRLARPGQKEDFVSIIHLIARNTIEEKMLRVLDFKQENAKRFNEI